jgi:nuclear transport factor 2 (NTF2) superfamily protein
MAGTAATQKVALAYTADSQWRNRSEFVHGRAEIIGFLRENGKRSSSTG